MENEKNNVVKEKYKSKKRLLKKLLTFLLTLSMVVLAFGLMLPGLLWTKNLGISYSKSDYESFMEKLNYVKDAAPSGDSADLYTYKYGEVKKVDAEFTSEEITAFFNENRPSYYALKNVQIKINDDETIEASALANVDYFLDNVLSGKYSREQIENEFPALGIIPSNVNVYLKFSGSVIYNQSSVNLESVTVQGIEIPNSMIDSNEAIDIVSSGINNIMANFNNETGSSFDKIVVENGKIKFQGSVPSSLERIEN